MSVGPRTSTLLNTTSPARRLDVRTSHAALAEACVITGDDVRDAELVSTGPAHVWRLPGSRALAFVHASRDGASALLQSAQLLQDHQVAVAVPYYSHVHAVAGQSVTFWHDPGPRSRDASLSAWVTALTHRIPPETAPWLREHDPFAGLLDGLDEAPLDEAARWFLREHATRLREEWHGVDWPTPTTVVLAGRAMAPCHDNGVHLRLLLHRPVQRGHREWDVAAARWRSELLQGHRPDDQQTYADTYLSYQHDDTALTYPYIGAWPGYQVVRDVLALTTVMHTVRRAHLDTRTTQLAAHQVACLRGAHPAPWNWRKR